MEPAVKSEVFPEFTVYCCARHGAYYMSLTNTEKEEINETVSITDRRIDKPKYTLSLCVKPMYGMNSKFILFTEYIEHYKLQGVQHFYIYVKDLIKHYVKNGEAEVVYFRKEQDRPSIEWHLVGTQDCIHRSRHHSAYTIYADMDERILPTTSNTTLVAYVKYVRNVTADLRKVQKTAQVPIKTLLEERRAHTRCSSCEKYVSLRCYPTIESVHFECLFIVIISQSLGCFIQVFNLCFI
ncbi:unnamed protein product [Heligmosomoides polygyrus]|uniref:Glycosyltransferase family 92 protein n=1 Tax=Heligmosomoides polygyrus TaxID=6339 RepID=A0A183FRJ7_HELPZ|nr:unnamed protein product [Heligmosomoides polygyrus]